MPNSQPCIDSNPDIAGIGVRSAIYAHALLSFVPIFLFLSDGRVTPYEEKTLNRIYVNTLITALALLINAFVQAGKFGISAYHALVILNLSWVNSVGAILLYFNHLVSRRSKGSLMGFLSSHFRSSFFRWPSVLASVQLCLMAALGIWVWGRITVFGNQPGCTPDTVASVFFRRISLENKGLRYASIIFYSIAAIPIINLLVFVFVFLLLASVVMILGLLLENHIAIFRDADRTLCISVMLCGAIFDILFAVDTELMIHWNKGRVKEGEEVWGFGQTLAVLMVIQPAIDVLKEISTWNKSRKRGFAQPVTAAIADGPVINLDNGVICIYYQGVDNQIYESRRGSESQGTLNHKKVSSVEARAHTPIAAMSWAQWDKSESIRVYYIDRDNSIREIHSSDGGAGFMDRPEPIAKAAQNSGLLYAIANSEVPGTIRVGFNSGFDPAFITEVIFRSQKDISAQPTQFTAPRANGSAIQLNNGDTRIYYQGADDHLYEHRLDSSCRDRDVLRHGEVPPNSHVVATTWGDDFNHIRIYFVDKENDIREICSDYGLDFVVRPRPVGKAAPNSVLLYATAEAPGKITVGFNSVSDPALMKEVSFQSATLTRGWRDWIRFIA